MPDGFKIASAYVTVSPDLSTFEDDLKARLEESSTDLKIPVLLDPQDIAATVQKIHDQVAEEGGARIAAFLDPQDIAASAERARQQVEEEAPAAIHATLDVASLLAKAEDVRLEVESIPVVVRLEADTARFQEKLMADLAEVNLVPVKVPVEPDVRQFETELTDKLAELHYVAQLPIAANLSNPRVFESEVAALVQGTKAAVGDATITVHADIDSGQAMKAAATAVEEMQAVADVDHLRVPVDINSQLATRSFDEFLQEYEQEGSKNVSDALSQSINDGFMQGIQESVDTLRAESFKIPLRPDTEELNQDIQNALDQVESAGMRGLNMSLSPAQQVAYRQSLQELLDSVSSEISANIPTHAQVDPLTWRKDINAQLGEMSNDIGKLPVTPDMEEFKNDLDNEITALYEDVRATKKLSPEVDLTDFRRDTQSAINDLRSQLDSELTKAGVNIPVRTDWRQAMTDLRAQVDTFLAEAEQGMHPITARVQADNPINKAWLTQVNASMRGIANDLTKVPVQADTAQFLSEVESELSNYARDVKHVPVGIDAPYFRSSVLAELDDIRNQVQEKIPVEVDANALNQSAQNAGKGAGSVLGIAIASALVLGGPIIAGAMDGIGTMAVLALSAKLDASQPQVQASMARIGTTLNVESHRWAFQLVDPIDQALSTLNTTIGKESPIITDIFHQVGTEIPFLTLGVTGLATNALPGLDFALQHSAVVAQGFAGLLEGIGSGINHVGDEIGSNSTTISADLSTMGNVGRGVISVFGDLLVTTSNIGEGALPLLSGGIHVVEEGLRGLNAIGAPVESMLGTLAVGGGAAFGVFKLGQLAVTGVTNAVQAGTKMLSGMSDGLLNVAAKLENVSPKLSTFALNVGKEIESLGPAGLAGIGMLGVAALSALTDADAAAAAHAQQHAAAVTALTQALSASNGVIDANVNSTLEQQLQQQKLSQNTSNAVLSNTSLSEALTKVGISQQDAVSAIEKGGPAYDSLNKQLTDISHGANGASKDQAAMAMAILQVLPSVKSAYGDAATQAGQLSNTQAQLAQSTPLLSAAFDTTASGTHVLALQLQDAGNQANNLTTFLNAVQTQLSEIADHGMEKANDATSAFYQGLQQLTSTVQSATGPILDMNGNLDLTSQRGQAVLTAIEGARNQMINYAGAMQNANQPQSAINAGLNTMEDALIGTLEKMGVNANEAHTLAEAYLAVPTNISTAVNLATGAAQDAMNKFIYTNNGRQITVYVNTQTGAVRAAGTTVSAQALGSIVMPMASGGVAAPIPSLSPIAQVVPPGTPRLIGDNPTVPEAYIPLNPQNPRSQQVLSDAMAVMGVQPNIVNHNNFNITATEPWMVSQQIMAQQQWLAYSARTP